MPPPGRAAGPGVGSLPARRRGTDPVHRPLQQGPGVRHGVSAGRAGRHPPGGDGAEGRRAAGPVSGGAAAVLCGRDPGPEPAVSVRLPESGVRLCRRAAPGTAPGIHRAGGRVRLPEYGAVRKALGQMVDRRAVAWRTPDRPAPAALPREQAALPPSGVRSGQRAVHRVFGPGTVLSFRDPIVEIRFPAKGDKKFVLSDSVQRGLLRLEE